MRMLLLALLALLSTPGWSLETVAEIRDCVRSNLPAETASQKLRLIAEDRGGGSRELQATLYGRELNADRIAVMLHVAGPADLAGSRYLLVDRGGRDDMYMYLPAMNRTKRILGSMTSQPLWGTDFSYEDVKHIQGIMIDGEIARLDDVQIGARTGYQISIKPNTDEESAYTEIRVIVDKDTCLVLQTEFQDESGPVKQLRVDPASFAQIKERWVAYDFTMENSRSGTRSYLKLDRVEYDERLSNNIFNPKTFHLAN